MYQRRRAQDRPFVAGSSLRLPFFVYADARFVDGYKVNEINANAVFLRRFAGTEPHCFMVKVRIKSSTRWETLALWQRPRSLPVDRTGRFANGLHLDHQL